MNVNKDKKIKAILDDSLKHRRSSLKVNLSCGSNLTDSGNESLKQTDIEYHDGTWLENNKPGCSNGKQTFVNHRPISYDIPSKTANVSLENISHNDAILNEHCEKLKYAILTKTNQMFDDQNELSLKTCTVLNAKDNQLSTTINNNLTCINEKQNQVEFKNTGTNLNQSINSISMDKYRNKSIKNQRKHNTLKKRLLFLAKEPSNDTNFITSQNQSLPASNTLIYEDTSIPIPIACSTMIDENNKISGTDDEIPFQDKNSLSLDSNVHAGNSMISMEVTDVCRGFILYDKPQSSVKCLAKNASEYCLQNRASNKSTSASLEQTLLQTNPNDEELLYETSNKFIKAATVNKDIEQNTSMQWNNPSIETDSANILQTSLNVNTSIDMVNESSNGTDKCTLRHKKKTCKNFKSRYKEGIHVAALEEAQESTNTVCTSLQMNTSLNTLSTFQKDDCRNITSELKNTKNHGKSEDTNLTEKHKEKNKINNVTISNWNRLVVDQIYSNEQSYIEATPYPMYRSVMLKSQLKQNAIACSLRNNNQFNGNEFKNSTDIHVEAKSHFPYVCI